MPQRSLGENDTSKLKVMASTWPRAGMTGRLLLKRLLPGEEPKSWDPRTEDSQRY